MDKVKAILSLEMYTNDINHIKNYLLSTMRHFELIIEPENKEAFLTTIDELKAVAETLPTVHTESG